MHPSSSRSAPYRFAVLLALSGFVHPALAAGPKAYVGNFRDNTVSVVDIASVSVVATIPVSAGPHGMGSSIDGKRVYIGGDASSNVDVIDVASDRVVRTIEVGRGPHGIAVAPDGKQVLVGVYGEDRVAFIDPSSDAVVGTVAVAKPHTIAIAPDGRLAYVASQEPGAFALVVVDLATRTVVRRLPLAKPPRDLEFAWDGRALYYTQGGVDAVQVLDPADDRLVAQIATGASPHIASRYRGAPAGTAVVQGPGEILLFDPATNLPLRSIAVGRQPHWIAWTGSGVVVTDEGSDDVSLVDLGAGTVRSVGVGKAPRKVTVPLAAADASASTGERVVAIRDFAFAPAALDAVVGETVTWTNADGAPHGVAFAAGEAGEAGAAGEAGEAGEDLILPGRRFTNAFATAGIYDYACPIHPFMRGRVTVAGR